MEFFGLSDKGRYRAENQDSFELGTVRDGVLEWGDMAPARAYFRALLAKEER